MSASRAIATAACALASVALSASAWAIDLADSPPSTGDRGALTAGADSGHHHWKDAGGRPFMAAVFEVGFAYARPTLVLGYGEPHHQWFGAEGRTNMTSSGGSDYIGVRGVIPYVDARVGLRYHYSFSEYYLTPQPFYTREETEVDLHSRASYLAFETELTASIPIPSGRIIVVGTGYTFLGTPDDRYLFEDAMKVVVDPQVLWRARLGYLAAIGWGDDLDDAMHLGGAVEVIHNPGRGAFTLRLGPLLSVPLTCHLDAVGAVMLTVSSPDQLGIRGADFGTLGLRYRWATGDAGPGFP